MPDKISHIKAQKNTDTPLVCLTAYSAPIAKIIDKYCDIILVGDSLGMVLYGMENTLDVTLDMMINHGLAVMRGSSQALVVIDMPYGTYEESPEQAYKNARRIMDETGAHAIKLEGGGDMAETIAYLIDRDIPVMGHIGLQPQSVIKDGGYKVKGKSDAGISKLLNDAKAVEKSGAFAVVIEGTIENIAEQITMSINIPTIGIGASAACDGQILVTDDMLGLITEHTPRFVKKYANLAQEIDQAAKNYSKQVKSRKFPNEDYTYNKKS